MLNETENENKARERVRNLIEDGSNVTVNKIRPKELPEWFDEKLFSR